MIMNWLRRNDYAAVFLSVLRLYLGWEWMIAGWHKIAGKEPFNAAGYIEGAVNNPVIDRATQDVIYPTYTSFLENIALPNAQFFSHLVAWGELFVGIGLFVGALTTAAMFFGLLMNFMYLFAGTISTNPWLVLLGFIIVAAGANAGKFGVDYYLLPAIKHLFTNRKNRKKSNTINLSPRANH